MPAASASCDRPSQGSSARPAPEHVHELKKILCRTPTVGKGRDDPMPGRALSIIEKQENYRYERFGLPLLTLGGLCLAMVIVAFVTELHEVGAAEVLTRLCWHLSLIHI